jgi:hypothetical protein
MFDIHRLRVRSSTLLITATCWSVAVACASEQVSSRDQTDVQLAGVDDDEQERLSALAQSIEASSEGDAGFSSVGVDPDVVTIYHTAPSNAVTSRYLAVAAGAGATVQIKPALVSRAQAQALEARLSANLEKLQSGAFTVNSFGPDGLGGPFHVGVGGDLAAARIALTQAYAGEVGGALDVKAEAPMVPLDRFNDSAPYFGGAKILTSIASCTAGFTGLSTANGQHYILTAYHCIDKNQPVVWDGGGRNDVNKVGAMSDKEIQQDTALVVANTAPFVWDGTRDSQFTKTVVGVIKPYYSATRPMLVWTDGSVTVPPRPGYVQPGYHHYTLNKTSTGEIYDVVLYQARSLDGAAMVHPGDSGGPVFTGAGTGRVKAVGLISASTIGLTDDVLFTDLSWLVPRHDLDLTR